MPHLLRISTLIAVAAACLLLPYSASAGWVQSRSVSGTGASTPRVAMGPGGTVTVLWLSGGGVRASSRAPRHGFKGLGALSGPGASEPDLTTGRSGEVGATWIQDAGAGAWSIRSARRTGSAPFVDRRQVASANAQPHAPQIDLDGSGDPTVAWTVDQTGQDEPRVIRIATGSAGGPYGAPATSSADNFLENLRLAVDANGRATIVWQSRPCIAANNCPEWNVHATSRPAGGSLPAMEQLTESTNSDTVTPRASVGVDDAGNVTAAWRIACKTSVPQPHCAGKPDGQYIRVASRGPLAPAFVPGSFLSSDVGSIDGPVALAVGPGGEAFAGWVPACFFGCRPTATRRSASGSSFGAPASLDGSSTDLVLAAGGGGRAIAAWRRRDDHRLRGAVAQATTSFSQGHPLSASGQSAPHVAQDAAGNGVAVWMFGGKVRAALYDAAPPVVDSARAPSRTNAHSKTAFSARAHDRFTAVHGVWDFGDGGRASGFKARHTYFFPGRFTATFSAIDAGGNTTSVTRKVRVKARRDRTPPRVKLFVPRLVYLSRILRGLRVGARCSEACLVTGTMFDGHRRISRAHAGRDRAGTVRIRLRLSHKARRRLRARHPRSVLIRFVAEDFAGNRRKKSARVYIR